ncbi:MAG: hypothetical protein HY681_03415 [Chloroflexi bacterium]|nr:hypothetical protein [Chloroflexota bacterium]
MTTCDNPNHASAPNAREQEVKAPVFPFKRFEQQLSLDVDDRAERIFQELNALTSEIYGTIYQAKARLLRMLQEEVQAMFAEILTKEDAWRIPTLEESGVKTPSLGKSLLESQVSQALASAVLAAREEAPSPPAPPASSAAPVTETPAQPLLEPEPLLEEEVEEPMDPDRVYEGTVRLKVFAKGRVRQSLQFIHDVGQLPQLSVLRLMGDQRAELDVWVGLRQPMTLGQTIQQVPNVAKVHPAVTPKGEPQLSVWLKA